MATFCSHCGEELPRDDARFCNNCGTMRTTRLPNSPSSAGSNVNSSSGFMPLENVRARAEDSIEQASPRDIKSQLNAEQSPAWMRDLQHKPRKRHSRPLKEQQTSAVPEQGEKPLEAVVKKEGEHSAQPQIDQALHTSVIERSAYPRPMTSSEQLDFPSLPSTPQSFSPARELHVKVWNEESAAQEQHLSRESVAQRENLNAILPTKRPSIATPPPEEQRVEDLPTRVMESVSQSSQAGLPPEDIATSPLLPLPEKQPPAQQFQSASKQDVYASLPQGAATPGTDSADIAYINTVQLQAQGQSSPPAPANAASFPGSPPGTSQPNVTPTSTKRVKKRLPLIIGASTVALLLILALSSWLVLAQPFRVSSVTDVQQSFTDARLGVSLRYPNGWKTPHVDYNKRTVTLQDASDTTQIILSVADANAASPAAYLQKQAAQLGMSNAKAGSGSSFAGSSWQSLQGDVQVKGAEYTCGLFTTTYKNHLYTVTQLAPRTIYADEEQLVFSPTRLSLHFL